MRARDFCLQNSLRDLRMRKRVINVYASKALEHSLPWYLLPISKRRLGRMLLNASSISIKRATVLSLLRKPEKTSETSIIKLFKQERDFQKPYWKSSRMHSLSKNHCSLLSNILSAILRKHEVSAMSLTPPPCASGMRKTSECFHSSGNNPAANKSLMISNNVLGKTSGSLIINL